jgi:uncharacterized protein (TIGR02246 family)
LRNENQESKMKNCLVVAAFITCCAISVGRAETPHSSPAKSAGAQETELAAFKKAIRHLYDIKEKAWASGDAETIVTKFYSADAVSIGEGDPATMIGVKEFRKAYLQYVKDVPKVRIESIRTVVNGNAGWDWTNFYHWPKPGKEKDYPPSPLRILFVFSKEHGMWICKGEAFVNGKFEPTSAQ